RADPAGQQLQKLPASATTYLQHAVLQSMDGKAASHQLHAHRIDQKRHIGVQHLDQAMGRLPAVLFVIGIEDLRSRLCRIKVLQQPPAGKRRPDKVTHAPLGKLAQSDDSEELLSEKPYLRQALLVNMLRQ